MHVIHKRKRKDITVQEKTLKDSRPVPVFGAGSGSGGGVRLGRGCAEMVQCGQRVEVMWYLLCRVLSRKGP